MTWRPICFVVSTDTVMNNFLVKIMNRTSHFQGRRLNIKWGRAQAQVPVKREGEDEESALEPVPGLPGSEYIYHRAFNAGLICEKKGARDFSGPSNPFVPPPGKWVCVRLSL